MLFAPPKLERAACIVPVVALAAPAGLYPRRSLSSPQALILLSVTLRQWPGETPPGRSALTKGWSNGSRHGKANGDPPVTALAGFYHNVSRLPAATSGQARARASELPGLSTLNPVCCGCATAAVHESQTFIVKSISLRPHSRTWAADDAVSGCEQSFRLQWKTESDRHYFAGGALAFLFLKTGMGASSL